VLLATLVTFEAASRESLATLLLAAPIWLAVGTVWLLRFAVAASRARLRMTAAEWTRWLIIPLATNLVFLLTVSDGLFAVRLAASRDAMEQLAADRTAGRSWSPGWIGLYHVSDLEPTANGFRFVVDDSALYRLGFAYSANGEPELTEENFSPLWTGAQLEAIGGGWWFWSEAWD
jgi:hypothetical protein